MIPVNEPHIPKHAKKYVLDCIRTGWISSAGSYIKTFEHACKEYFDVNHAVTVTSGTSALHLALVALGITKGDEVILPDLTIISCPFAVHYTGATPVLCDVEPDTGNIDPKKIEEKITKKTKAIMVVHLYGHPCDMDPIRVLAKKYHLFVVEDACQAHGALYQGKKVGGLGDIGCFSFYGNKIITTGEGGMVVTNSDILDKKLRTFRDLAHVPGKRFTHKVVGYNYRMTNMQAALGLSGIEEIDWAIAKKRRMAQIYQKGLKDIPSLILPEEKSYARSVFWMYAVRLTKKSKMTRDEFCSHLKQQGVDTRNFFVPIHRQPVFRNMKLFLRASYPVSDALSRSGLYIPSGLAMTEAQQHEVIRTIRAILT